MAEWRITSEDVVLQTPWFEVSRTAVELPLDLAGAGPLGQFRMKLRSGR